MDYLRSPSRLQQWISQGSVWCVYLLRLSDGSLYCGCTNRLAQRLSAHASGKGSRLVRARLPFLLVYLEEIPGDSRSSAQKREAAIKRLSKAAKEALCQAWQPPELVTFRGDPGGDAPGGREIT